MDKTETRYKELYKWILDFVALNGRFPTLEQIGKKEGVTRQRAGIMVNKLARDGYLVKGERSESLDYLLKVNPLFIEYGLRQKR